MNQTMLIIMHWLNGLNVVQHILAACSTPKCADHADHAHDAHHVDQNNTFAVQCDWQGSHIRIGVVKFASLPNGPVRATLYSVIQKMLQGLPSDNCASTLVDDFQVFHQTNHDNNTKYAMSVVDHMTDRQLGEALRAEPRVLLGPIATLDQAMCDNVSFEDMKHMFGTHASKVCMMLAGKHATRVDGRLTTPQVLEVMCLVVRRHDAAFLDMHKRHWVVTLGALCWIWADRPRPTIRDCEHNRKIVARLVDVVRIGLGCQHDNMDVLGIQLPKSRVFTRACQYVDYAMAIMLGVVDDQSVKQAMWDTGFAAQVLSNCVGMNMVDSALYSVNCNFLKSIVCYTFDVWIPAKIAKAAVALLRESRGELDSVVQLLVLLDTACRQPRRAYQLAVQAGVLDHLVTLRPCPAQLAQVLAKHQPAAFWKRMKHVVFGHAWLAGKAEAKASIFASIFDWLDQHHKIQIATKIDAASVQETSLITKCLDDPSGVVRQAFFDDNGANRLCSWIVILVRACWWEHVYKISAEPLGATLIAQAVALGRLLTAAQAGRCATDFVCLADKQAMSQALTNLLNTIRADSRSNAELASLYQHIEAAHLLLSRDGALYPDPSPRKRCKPCDSTV